MAGGAARSTSVLMRRLLFLVALVLAAPVLLFGAVIGLILMTMAGDLGQGEPGPDCEAPALSPTSVTGDITIAGYGPEQLTNASEIMRAGADLGISAYGQTVGVMTAMGESNLQVLDRGDAAGPDSRGLFQQRDNGAWGTYQDRMDPYTSATNFFEALQQVPGWEELEPTIAAHRTQRNRDPYHYSDYWPEAVQIVEALSANGTPSSIGPSPCAPLYSGVATDSGWAHPVPGFTTYWGNYGTAREGYTHAGEDLAAPAGQPILAVAAGTVSHASCQPWQGRSACNVLIDHGVDERGREIQSLYVHMYPEGVDVIEGQAVTAGEEIGAVGNNGQSTGYHLHFEIWIDGEPVDPEPFMASMHIDLTDPSATEVVNALPEDTLEFIPEDGN